jgi:hypothetical protein
MVLSASVFSLRGLLILRPSPPSSQKAKGPPERALIAGLPHVPAEEASNADAARGAWLR